MLWRGDWPGLAGVGSNSADPEMPALFARATATTSFPKDGRLRFAVSSAQLVKNQASPVDGVSLTLTIKGAIEAARVQALPSSALAKGCNYTLTLWSRLTRFLHYAQLELSNNLAENAIRPVALGRKNCIHIGSKEAGPRVAAIVSIVETCRRLDIHIRDYLGSILPGLANRPISQTAKLTPAAWAYRNRSATAPPTSSAV
jgi:Transposase IS66 family